MCAWWRPRKSSLRAPSARPTIPSTWSSRTTVSSRFSFPTDDRPTRDGAFKKDGTGRLVTSDGFFLEPEIVIPDDALEVTIGTDGTVSGDLPGDPEPQYIGQIELARFINPAGLQATAATLYLATASSGPPIVGTPGLDGFGMIPGLDRDVQRPGGQEMVNMITSQRAYEVNSKAIQASDDMLQTANNLRR